MTRGFQLAMVLVAMVLIAGCSKPEAPSKPPPTPTPPAAPAQPVAGSGTIVGRVTFTGSAPPSRALRMNADPYCADANKEDSSEPVLVIGPGGALAEAFVHVKSDQLAAAGPAPEQAAVIDQQGCRYRPRVLGVQVDQPLEFRNSDTTLHNVHAVPEQSKGFNIGMPTKGMTAVRKFSTPEVFVRIKCDVHPWMAAYVGVVTHPYFAVTGADGTFRIANVPVGKHTIEAAHPTLGRQTETVIVQADGEVTADFAFSQ